MSPIHKDVKKRHVNAKVFDTPPNTLLAKIIGDICVNLTCVIIFLWEVFFSWFLLLTLGPWSFYLGHVKWDWTTTRKNPSSQELFLVITEIYVC